MELTKMLELISNILIFAIFIIGVGIVVFVYKENLFLKKNKKEFYDSNGKYFLKSDLKKFEELYKLMEEAEVLLSLSHEKNMKQISFFERAVKLTTAKNLAERIKGEVDKYRKGKERSSDKEIIISNLFLKDKVKKNMKAIRVLFFSIIILTGVYLTTNEYLYLLIIAIVMYILILLFQKILEYRIRNGLFGTNDYEAKQLIAFVVDNKDKFDDGHKIFNTENISVVVSFSTNCLDRSKVYEL